MKVDRKLFEKFGETIKGDAFIQEQLERGDIASVEEYVRTELFDKPTEFFNLEKLRKAVKTDRRISLREFIENIFAGSGTFKSKDELLEEEFAKFVAIYKPDSKYALAIKNYLKAYITDAEVREIIESREFPRLATNPKLSMADFKGLNGWRTVVPEYVKDYVSLNAFL